ncbi:MAG: Hpt domain-containing protein [Humidesulfovibrio sp.]|jgi:two-component system chemotaxis sensor kinase CheA|uniref:Hpt domain-containing protein n=1 Tax=Humidesulfovibrio sp. TaxID=2910988 RepID=UPI002735720C|nr:Hpt domain-containing protein [Humidesulfovibrio sp.]MDP2848884.1 Hpt domain-containing protein [Humidesulfovibrio sp.]
MFDHDPEVLAAFAEESAVRISSLEKGLLELEREPATPSTNLLNAVFRDAHSVKAGANLLGLRQVETAAHRLENVLDMLRSGRLSAEPEVCQSLLDGVDLLREILEAPQSARNIEADHRLTALANLTT